MASRRRLFGPLLVIATLAGCAGSSTLPHHYVYDGYRPDQLSYAASRGGMPTEIIGNPFEAPKAALEAAVIEHLEARSYGPRLSFFTEVPEEVRSPYRVVVLFNPAVAAAPSDLCSNPNQPQEPRGNRVGVLAAFCDGPYRVNSVGGYVEGPRDPGDPAFRQLMGQVATLLFPPRPGDLSPNDSGIMRAN